MREWLLLLAACSIGASQTPRVFILRPAVLRKLKASPSESFPQALRRAADRAMRAGPFSVTDSGRTPPSGDKHDYMSQAPYWWPNPATPSGLPYIRRDGERNPEINRITDHRDIGRMSKDVRILALAYYFTGDEAYAAHAAVLLRTWFLNPATAMNPNLQYAQAVPGRNNGRGTGIIESRELIAVPDAAGLLAGSKAWSAGDEHALENWFAHFLAWLRDSPHGRAEGAAKNNHGTWYDAQVADFALYTGETEVARQILEQVEQERIARQIEPDGRQPLETARTRGISYSVMNLTGLVMLARLGEDAGENVWDYRAPDGASIRKALDWLLPYLGGQAKWPYKQITPFHASDALPVLREAARHYGDARYQKLADQIADRADPLSDLY
jgi:Alginate lyase